MEDAIPSIEMLMERLEKAGMEKEAADLRDVVAVLGLDPFKMKQRRLHSRGAPPRGTGYTFDPSQPMLQEGERYTEIDPTTGKESPKRYRYDQPLPVSKLQPYFQKGMFDTDFLQGEYQKETDPRRKELFKRLLDEAEKNERVMSGRKAAEAVMKCASALRGKGYDALAGRLESKVATGVYAPGKGVRIRSLKEYIEESKAGLVKDKSLFDEMFNKYIRVLEGAAQIVRKAQQDSKGMDETNEALKLIMTADRLFMQKLLEIGETTELTKGEGI